MCDGHGRPPAILRRAPLASDARSEPEWQNHRSLHRTLLPRHSSRTHSPLPHHTQRKPGELSQLCNKQPGEACSLASRCVRPAVNGPRDDRAIGHSIVITIQLAQVDSGGGRCLLRERSFPEARLMRPDSSAAIRRPSFAGIRMFVASTTVELSRDGCARDRDVAHAARLAQGRPSPEPESVLDRQDLAGAFSTFDSGQETPAAPVTPAPGPSAIRTLLHRAASCWATASACGHC